MSDLAEQLVQREAVIAELQATNDALTKKLARLEFLVAKLTREKYGKRSEQSDSEQQMLFDVESSKDPKPPQETTVKPHKRRRGGGRLKIPEHFERTIVEHDIEDKACPSCGEERQKIGFESSEQIDLIPTQLYVIEHRRLKYACRKCEEQVAIAPPVKKPIAKGMAGAGLLAAVGVGKFSEHRVQGEAVFKMREGLSRPGDRTWLQTGPNCDGQEPWWEALGLKGVA